MSEPPSLRDLAGIGSAIAGMVAGGVILGLVIDSQLGSSPLCTLIGVAIGVISAGIYIYSVGKRFWKE